MAGSRTLKLSILADVADLKKNLDAGSKEVDGFGDKLEKFSKVAAAAFAAAAAAALAYAGKLAIDGVKAAIADQAAQENLANALRNTTTATDAQIASVENQISQLSLATGVADDKLRPAFQRLAIATNDVDLANKNLKLALDISAATGKDVETVANALAKAYEGNTGALGRLGVGLSNAEIKSLGLDGTMNQLAETFGGAATVKANTLEGQIARLKVRFDETKESIGNALLPTVERMVNYFTNDFIPKMTEAKDKAVSPIKDAFADNEDAMADLVYFGKTYLVPFFEVTLVKAIQGVGNTVGMIIRIIAGIVNGIESLINGAITGINKLIAGWNAIPDWAKPGGDIKLIPKVDFNPNSDNRINGIQLPFGGGSVIPENTNNSFGALTNSGGFSGFGGSSGTGSTGSSSSSGSKSLAPTLIEQVTAANALKQIPAGVFDPASFRAADNIINITVNGAIDPVSTAQQINQILTDEANRAGNFAGGVGSSVFDR